MKAEELARHEQKELKYRPKKNERPTCRRQPKKQVSRKERQRAARPPIETGIDFLGDQEWIRPRYRWTAHPYGNKRSATCMARLNKQADTVIRCFS